MDKFIGKTIETIEEDYYGMWVNIHFTDGSSMIIRVKTKEDIWIAIEEN
jgi:hypothetical protein